MAYSVNLLFPLEQEGCSWKCWIIQNNGSVIRFLHFMGFKTSFEYFTELLQNISTDTTDSLPCIIHQFLDTL